MFNNRINSDWEKPGGFSQSVIPDDAGEKIKGPLPEKFPPPEKCATCHDITRTYEELLRSRHSELKCLDCHVPGKVQRAKYESKDCSFSRLGYHDKEGEWIECTDGSPKNNLAKKSWQCDNF
jgi:hypothetical protein